MDDLLLIVMRGGLTRAEHTMLDFDEADLVRNFRQTFESKMTERRKDRVERLTGRRVLTCLGTKSLMRAARWDRQTAVARVESRP